MATLAARIQRTEQRLAKRKAEPVMLYVDPVYFARHKLGFRPDAWQARILQSESKRLLLNCCRQSGKSTTTAILSLHQSLYFPGSLVLLISPSLRQSAELFRKVLDHLAALPVRPSLTEDNKLSLRLKNGSRIVSLPSSEATVRGFSAVSLLIEDESARVPDSLHLACKPMLATSNGRMILMSTPWGRRGHFFEAWENGGPSWERVRVTARDCPRIPATFLAGEEASMPAAWFRSEYCCAFTDNENSVFRSEDIAAALSGDVKPLWPVDDDFQAMIRRERGILQ